MSTLDDRINRRMEQLRREIAEQKLRERPVTTEDFESKRFENKEVPGCYCNILRAPMRCVYCNNWGLKP